MASSSKVLSVADDGPEAFSDRPSGEHYPAAPVAESSIEVRAPYCALKGVRSPAPGVVQAVVHPEQAVDLEVGELAAAEAGRHMAILGSIACATLRTPDEPRYYYLAQRARLSSPETLSSSTRSGTSNLLRLSATSVASRARECEADCEIRSAEGEILFGLRVGYKMVPEKVFQRLFAAFRVDMRKSGTRTGDVDELTYQRSRRNPYLRRLSLSAVEVDGTRVRGELRNIPAEACSGHFPMYPALPVAVLMEAFSNGAGALLRERFGTPELRYRVRSADILASKLVFAGQSLAIHGEVLEDLPGLGARMRMRASLSETEDVSTATFVMEGVEAGASETTREPPLVA